MFFPQKITKIKPSDKVLEIGPGGWPHPRSDVFFELEYVDEEEFKRQRGNAEKFSAQGAQLLKKSKVKVITLKNVIDKHANKVFPDILSLDVEGHELAVLHRFEEFRSKPKIICCETVEYSSNGKYIKNKKLIKYIENCGYKLHADTLINSIFINQDLNKSK